MLQTGEVACFIVEPAMENIGICLPDDGYLEGVRELTRRYGTLLIFDEVKTGITAGWSGATGHFGVQPDLVALAKSIGGGLPIGAFGGEAEYMDEIGQGRVLHLGTYNGNPLVMAGAKAVLRDICTPEATQATIDRNDRLLAATDADHRRGRPARPHGPARREGLRHLLPPSASATTATTRPPTSTSPSPAGSGASTAASCCRPASTSSG